VKRWDLESIILESGVSDNAKIVGLVLVRHWSARYDTARITMQRFMYESGGKSKSTVTRAMNELVKAGIFTRIRTGRSSIFRLGEYSKNQLHMTNSRSVKSGTSRRPKKPIIPQTGTRFKEYCPPSESTEDAGEMYTKHWELLLGF